MKKISLLLASFFLAITYSSAQLVITPGGGAATVTAAVGGPGLTISNVTINCNANAYGAFSNGAASGMGVTSGLIMTTGDPSGVPGTGNSNDDLDYCINLGQGPADAQLTSLSSSARYDQCIIQFDVVPQCNVMSITFVFGSDEYTNYVDQTFNDAFGFFVSGPNPSGGNYVNYNTAIIPGGTIVSIDNVNQNDNSGYFHNNNAGGAANHYDGYTTVLTPSMNVTPCATYHFKLAIADAGDCAMDSGVMIDIIQCVSPWTAATSSTPASCGVSNGTATATVSGGIGPFTYSWAPSGGTGATASGLAAGTYTATVNDGLSCTPPQTYTVAVGGSGGSAVAVNSTSMCAGGSAMLTATPVTGGGTYSWSPGGATTQSITVSPANTTIYTCSYTLSGCTNTNTGTVTVNPLPTVTASSPPICNGGTATLTAGGATSYTWSAGATSTGTNTASASPATSTSYTVTGTAGTCSNTAVVNVVVNPLPSVTVSSANICPGGTAALTAGGATSYTWSAGATSTGTNTASASPATSSTYTVTGTTTGCSATAVATVTVGASLTVTVNSPTICTGGVANLTAGGASTYTWSAGVTAAGADTADASPATTTSYTVTGTTGSCSGTAVATVTVNPIPTVTVNPATICNGATALLTAGGAGTYTWSAGATSTGINTASAAPSTSTTYTVTGTAAGCSNTAVSAVTVNPVPAVTVDSPTICPGGTATMTAGGATSYTWSAGATAATTNTATASPATTTTYTVTGTTSGCSATAVSTVSIGASLTVTVNSPTICAGETANLTAGGAASYTWSAGVTAAGADTADASPATTTSYTVTGTTGGCSGTAVTTVTVNPIPTITVNSPVICNGVTAGLTANGAAAYTWSAGATSTGINTANASPSTNTTYTVTGTDSGCSSTAVSTVTVNPIPVTTVDSPSICPGSTATMTAGGATSYTWSAGATTASTNTATASPAATTTYTVTGTSLSCSSTAVSTVTINNALSVDAGINDSICFGDTVHLLAIPNGPGFTYNWSPAATLNNGTIYNPVASPAVTTTYSVTVTDANGCVGSDSVKIFANPKINLAIAGLPASCNGVCDGQTIVIPSGGSGIYTTYAWSGGCNTPACTQCDGSYSVTVTDSWGCAAVDSTTVSEPTVLTASIAPPTQVSCFGLCDGSATASGAGGTGIYSYSWNTVPVQTTATATGLCAGTYTCTVTDANNCTAIDTVVITEPTRVVIAPSADVTICNAGTTNLSAVVSGGNGAPYSYLWTPAIGLSSDIISNPVATPAGTTTYIVNAADVNGCPAIPDTIIVTVNPPLSVVTAGSALICPGASTPISATASNGSGSSYTYSWLPATGLSNPASADPNANPNTTTTYTVTAADGCSPSVTATVTVAVQPLATPIFSANVTSGCAPLCVTFTDASTIPSGSITGWGWDFTDTTGLGVGPNPTHCFLNPGSYSITLTDTSATGCISSVTYNNFIVVNPIPTAAFTAPISTSIITPTVPFTDNSTGASQWYWNFNDPFATGPDSVSTLPNPAHTFSEVGTYCVDLLVTGPTGCTNSTQLCIVIDPEFTFFIPNAFSPNDDGVNDEFYGKGDFINDFEMSIYDRWGNMIFFCDDINKHWTGLANHGSEIAQQDVYVYVVKLTDNKDKKHKYIGTVTLVK